MQAVSPALLQTIKELQHLQSLNAFALAGGTNLALRFNHRISEDIDLFSTNIIDIDGFEKIKGVICYDVKDIGLFKLVSCSNRPAKKDIYDLEYITESNNLIDLYNLLKGKKEKFNKDTDRNIFDLDNDPDPIDDPHLLLLFDKRMATKQKMRHSHDNILNIEGSKSWREASMYWRMKVRRLYKSINIDYPL